MTDILKRDATGIDPILLLWGAVFAVMCIRSISMIALQAVERFDSITYLALISTPTSLVIGYWGIITIGPHGALLGLIAGELVDVVGIAWATRREFVRSKIANNVA